MSGEVAWRTSRPAVLWVGLMVALAFLVVLIFEGFTYYVSLTGGLLGIATVVVLAVRRRSDPWTRDRLASPILVGVAAVAIGFTVFGVSAMHEPVGYLGPAGIVETLAWPGFDAWTGEPHGRVYTFAPFGSIDGLEPRLVREPPPPQIAGRWAIPVWVGAVGTLLVAAVIRFVRRRV
jgi:hypothetical protein